MIVDRKNRDALVAAINRFLDGQTTAFQFDEDIFGIKSNDLTISHTVRNLWYFYDDLMDHKVRLSKESWDYIQRLILVLRSDGHVEIFESRRWDYTQLVAVAALLLFIYAAHWLGFGMQLLALAIPFGLVSIALSSWRSRKETRSVDKTTVILTPFSTLSELIHLRRNVPAFRKRNYPAWMKPFKIRTHLEETTIILPAYAAWMLFSPLVLIFQALPPTETETRIVM
jgi:hypothetical protein